MCSDTQRTASTQCQYPGCTKGVWQDPDGSYSSFCGNTHRLAMASGRSSQVRLCEVGQRVEAIWHRTNTEAERTAIPSPFTLKMGGVCHPLYSICGAVFEVFPFFFFLVHDFCGLRCAGKFNDNGGRSSQPRTSPPPGQNMCTIPGCQKRAYVNEDGTATDFCSNRHRRYGSLRGRFHRALLK